MRTKTLALSALLGALTTASVVAQTNVYSLNAVGYINVTLYPGYNLVTCPLICSPDNTVATLFNNSNEAFQGATKVSGHFPASDVYVYQNGVGYSLIDNTVTADGGNNGWANGTETLNPGQAVFFFNPLTVGSGTNMYATFVGTVPQNSTPISSQLPNGLTNTIVTNGYSLIGSIVPASGDIITNSIMLLTNLVGGFTRADQILTFDPTYNGSAQGGYSTEGVISWTPANGWNGGGAGTDPYTFTVYNGFWYFNNSKTVTKTWIENFSINP